MILKWLFLFLCVVPFMVSCTDPKQKKIDEINKTIHQYEKVMIDGEARICTGGKPLTKDALRRALEEFDQIREQLDELEPSASGSKSFKGNDLELKNDNVDWARQIEREDGRSALAYTQVMLLSLAMNAPAFTPPTDHLNPNLYHSSRQTTPYAGGAGRSLISLSLNQKEPPEGAGLILCLPRPRGKRKVDFRA